MKKVFDHSQSSVEQLLTTKHVADHLRVTVQTLHAWNRNGSFVPASRTGKSFGYSQQQVRARMGVGSDVALLAANAGGALLSVAEAAELLGISVTRLRTLDLNRKLVPALRTETKRRYYTFDQIQAFKHVSDDVGMPSCAARILVHRRQAAKMLGVDVRTMQRWEYENRLVPVAREGQLSFYTRSQLDEFSARQRRFSAMEVKSWLADQLRRAEASGSQALMHAVSDLCASWSTWADRHSIEI